MKEKANERTFLKNSQSTPEEEEQSWGNTPADFKAYPKAAARRPAWCRREGRRTGRDPNGEPIVNPRIIIQTATRIPHGERTIFKNGAGKTGHPPAEE